MRSLAPLLVLSLALLGCPRTAELVAADQDEEEIRAVLHGETRAALNRDYPAWREHWVHAPYVVKTYLDLRDGTGSETRGWAAVDDFVRTYIEAHPEPEPPPPQIDALDIRLYGDGASVTYVQRDADQGWKRESRLLERVDGAWRIAGMHTTIYGDERPD